MSVNPDLDELIELVQDEESFIVFLSALASDKEQDRIEEEKQPSSPWGPSIRGWENGTIETFLDAAAAWGSSSKDGLPNMEKSENPWRRAADIIFAGKFYE